MAKSKGASLEQTLPSPRKDERDYETENHLDTLSRAADIMSDPEKMKKVHKMAGRKHKALKGLLSGNMPSASDAKIKSLDDLKKVAYSKKDDDEDME